MEDDYNIINKTLFRCRPTTQYVNCHNLAVSRNHGV